MVRDEYNHSRPVSALIRDWLLYNKAGGGGGILKTVTGNPISVSDALAAPIKSLSVSLSPIQAGSGDPYPAGGGKNLFNGTFLQGYWAYANGKWISVTEWVATEKIPCKPSTYYTASADNRQTRWQGFVYYDNNGDFISTQNLNNKLPIGYTAKTPANAAYLIFNIAGESETTDIISPSDVTHFQLEEGQTATSYAPYSNICPISGWTGVTVQRTGKNLFGGETFARAVESAAYAPQFSIDTDAKTFTFARGDANTDGNYIHRLFDKFSSPQVTAIITYSNSAQNSSILLRYTDNTSLQITLPSTSDSKATIVLSSSNDKTVDCVELNYYSNGSTTIYYDESGFFDGVIALSDFEPYQSASVTVNFGQTVYGGTLDVLSGLLTVNWAMVDLGAKNWYPSTAVGRTRFRTSITDIERISSPDVRASLLCSNYPTKTANQTYQGTTGVSLQQNSADIYIYDPQMESMTEEEFKSAMSGVQLVYELATPQTITLDPATLSTLKGDNTVWSDGDDISMTYKAAAE